MGHLCSVHMQIDLWSDGCIVRGSSYQYGNIHVSCAEVFDSPPSNIRAQNVCY